MKQSAAPLLTFEHTVAIVMSGSNLSLAACGANAYFCWYFVDWTGIRERYRKLRGVVSSVENRFRPNTGEHRWTRRNTIFNETKKRLRPPVNPGGKMTPLETDFFFTIFKYYLVLTNKKIRRRQTRNCSSLSNQRHPKWFLVLNLNPCPLSQRFQIRECRLRVVSFCSCQTNENKHRIARAA